MLPLHLEQAGDPGRRVAQRQHVVLQPQDGRDVRVGLEGERGEGIRRNSDAFT